VLRQFSNGLARRAPAATLPEGFLADQYNSIPAMQCIRAFFATVSRIERSAIRELQSSLDFRYIFSSISEGSGTPKDA
jgi:hypothetical protein